MTPTNPNDHDLLVRIDERVNALIEKFDDEMTALRRDMHAEFAQRDTAQRLKATQDKQHFEDLNHENARIAAAASKSVNVDVYTTDRDANAAAAKVRDAAVDEKFSLVTASIESLRQEVIGTRSGDEGVVRGGDRQKASEERTRVAIIGLVLAAIAVVSFIIARGV